MTVQDLDDVWGNGLTPVEIHAWEDGSVGEKIYWQGDFNDLWDSGYMDYYISDIYIDQLTCGLVISLPACDLEEEEDDEEM